MSSKPRKGRPKAPWTQKALDALSDGVYHKYTDIFAIVMNAIPPEKARQAYFARTQKLVGKKPLAEQIAIGAATMAKQSLGGLDFVILNKETDERVTTRDYKSKDRPLWIIRKLTEEEREAAYARRVSHLVGRKPESTRKATETRRKKWMELLDELTDEEVLKNTSRTEMVAFIMRPHLHRKITININGTLLENAVPVVYMSRKYHHQICGYMTTDVASSTYIVYEVWPEPRPPKVFHNPRDVVVEGKWRISIVMR